MDNDKIISRAEEILGVTFKDATLLRTALTHSSYAYEHKVEFNEKMEFLGDSVLGLAVTEYIFLRFPEFEEGDLAKLRANLVKAETLNEIAIRLTLGDLVIISSGTDQAGGRENSSILADCLEAIIGAIYLDQGYESAKVFVLKNLEDRIFREAARKDLSDPKTILQELTMQERSILPTYRIVDQKGMAHNPTFSAEVYIEGKSYGSGVGKSKKKAEQVAAKVALEELAKKSRESS